MSKSDPNAPKRLALIASKGTLDWAYPPFILATAAGAMGWEVGVFFTFYGLTLLKPDLSASVSPLGNPAMPMKMPFGPEGFQNIAWPMPNLLMANVPGFEALATTLMKQCSCLSSLSQSVYLWQPLQRLVRPNLRWIRVLATIVLCAPVDKTARVSQALRAPPPASPDLCCLMARPAMTGTPPP